MTTLAVKTVALTPEPRGNPTFPLFDIAPASIDVVLASSTILVSQTDAPAIPTDLAPPSRSVDSFSASIDELFGDIGGDIDRKVTSPPRA
ncbi:unnamed protein product [Ilex paraguariensis]|uniref:Uncharacterized protein n=1 Tax=Ilex paraguariensis TaxID=185542 RepID=A0ABC8RUP4_9AQUA